jgi:hypothetical protein
VSLVLGNALLEADRLIFPPILAPFPIAYSVAGFLFGATVAAVVLLARRPRLDKPDPRHSPEAWARAGVFGWVWPSPAEGSANAVFTLIAVLAAGLAGSALPRLANSQFDRSDGVGHLVEIIDQGRSRSKYVPDQHFAVVPSPIPPRLPLRIPILEPAGNVVGMCIGMQVHPGLLNVPWYLAETKPTACPDQGSKSDESP